jgi:plasmid stabilization system protein ParE
MSVRKSDEFIADIEQQFEWYALNASWEISERYLDAVEATVQLLAWHPQLGPLVVSIIRDSANGDTSSCSVPSTNTFSFMKSPATAW